jgi:cytoskeletal protein CcmA (bactofilin family)
MKDKPRETEETKLAGLIDRESEFRGDLVFKGSFRIEGFFKGTIVSDSLLIVGDKAKVEAEIKVGQVIINGEIKGTVHAAEKVEIHNRGRVFGSIISPRLIVEEGAYLEANCQTQEIPPAASAQKREGEKEG